MCSTIMWWCYCDNANPLKSKPDLGMAKGNQEFRCQGPKSHFLLPGPRIVKSQSHYSICQTKWEWNNEIMIPSRFRNHDCQIIMHHESKHRIIMLPSSIRMLCHNNLQSWCQHRMQNRITLCQTEWAQWFWECHTEWHNRMKYLYATNQSSRNHNLI